MHSKLLYTYLVIATSAEGIALYVEMRIAFSLFLILTAAQWVIVPLLCQCAKKLGLNQGYDRGLEEAELIITAELEHHTTTTNGAHAGAVAE